MLEPIFLEKENYMFTEIAEYKCNVGYNFSNDKHTLECLQNGNFQTDNIKCQADVCNENMPIKNGEINVDSGTNIVYGDSVTISCNEG